MIPTLTPAPALFQGLEVTPGIRLNMVNYPPRYGQLNREHLMINHNAIRAQVNTYDSIFLFEHPQATSYLI